MQYSPTEIDLFAKKIWHEHDIYKVENDFSKPKYYVLEMFPYPSGAGLHVGHPLGYVASDIFARYKRMMGFNVLHPMGFDSFGLPAEQYAIETGKHPKHTTEENIQTYKKQFKKIGLSFDWSREIVTSHPEYYKWTQWLFIEMFNSYYDDVESRAKPISDLISRFEAEGSLRDEFSKEKWIQYSEKEKSDILMRYRLIYTSMGEVNWCEALGTVLANDEVINGHSERGNHPVIKKKMRQWSLRMTAYAERLLQNLDFIDFPNPLKEQQRNWIGKSMGALIKFDIVNQESYKIDTSSILTSETSSLNIEGAMPSDKSESFSETSKTILNSAKIQTLENIEEKNIEVYSTRPDTIFGATFIVLAPEHPLVSEITTPEYQAKIDKYISYCKSKSDIDRQAEKEVSGQFTGAYAIHPFTEKNLPIYIAEYILMGYGTGAIMAVPAEDERDQKFAEKFGIEIIEIYAKTSIANAEIGDKQGVLIHSDFINGMDWREGFDAVVQKLLENGDGEYKTQFRLRDANFSRQRYWGEPIPILWKNEIPYPLDTSLLPLKNPEVDSLLPSKEGLAPNSRNQEWVNEIDGYQREVDTMPAFAASSWYFLRFMDPQNDKEFVDKKLATYWNQVDLYQGGSEHAVGHLLYARYFNLFLYDRGYVSFEEPFTRLINQGMIQGRSQFIYRSNSDKNLYVSKGNLSRYQNNVTPLRVDVNLVENDELNIDAFRKWRTEYAEATFDLENEKYICGWEIEKMSKSKYNVVNPDTIIDKYGADTFRMYEMFLGPIEQSKPWNTAGIEGVSKFLRRFWNLYLDENGLSKLTNDAPSIEELKILHKTIDKLHRDIENFSFNTAVSSLMIALNELNQLKTNSSHVLLPLLKAICPLAPHTSETIWQSLGMKSSIITEKFPIAETQYLIDDTIEYPISINGKTRAKISLSADADELIARKIALSEESVQKWIEGKEIKRFIFVKSRMINIVV